MQVAIIMSAAVVQASQAGRVSKRRDHRGNRTRAPEQSSGAAERGMMRRCVYVYVLMSGGPVDDASSRLPARWKRICGAGQRRRATTVEITGQ